MRQAKVLGIALKNKKSKVFQKEAAKTESGAYFALSNGYDKLNSETDYSLWASFIEKCFEKWSDIKIESVLDLGCGTGAMTFELCRRGYDMTGLDISCEMLSVAKDTSDSLGMDGILWLCQDMRSFELYGTVQGAVCCLDGINHLCGVRDLEKCLSLLHNYVEPGGVFVFDVNTPKKFAKFYGDNDYILEDENIMCCWQNEYDRRRGICTFYLTVFEKNDDGSWRRTDTEQREKCYTRRKLEASLTAAGFEVCGFFGDFDFTEASDDDHRWYIVAKRL